MEQPNGYEKQNTNKKGVYIEEGIEKVLIDYVWIQNWSNKTQTMKQGAQRG